MTATSTHPDELRTESPPPASVGWAPLLVVLAGTFVTFLDFFIVNVALPSIHEELHAGASSVSLVVAGYGLTFAAGMITGGRLGDIYGRRRMFVLGLLLFTLTSAACGLAPTALVLVLARVVQGLAGAVLTPQVLAILGTVYSGDRRAKAFAAFGFAMGIAGVLGQLLGGALIQADVAGLGWRVIFLINVPVGLVAVPLARRVVPESCGTRSPLDLVGTALGTGTLVALILPLVQGRQQGWPLWTWVGLAAAPALGALFVVHQRARAAQGRTPLVDPGLGRAPGFVLGSLVGLVFATIPPSLFFVLALYLQQGRGYDPLFAGVVFIAVGVGYFAAMLAAGPLAARLGHQVLALGALGVSFGCVGLATEAHAHSALALVPGLALAGFGIGAVLVPLPSTVLAAVAPEHAGAAAGVLTTAQQTGGALGVAITSVVFFARPGIGASFTTCVWILAGLGILTAAMVQLLRN
jgi:EmrB/QacA subfamily drug resistance transporter